MSNVVAKTQLSIRIDLKRGDRIGLGKIARLEAISKTGSITAAAQSIRVTSNTIIETLPP
jgi:molybdenum-dependent DNA-binding transcriptional regulator ModE